MPLVNVPINIGSKPDWNTRLGYPNLFNMFVGKSGNVYHTPKLNLIREVSNAVDVKFTPFQQGSFIVVTRTSVLRVLLDGTVTFIAPIIYSGQAAQIAQNLQNQVGVCDGRFAYVFDQTANTFTQLGAGIGFAIENPISVTVLNGFMVWLGAGGSWQPSKANNALLYDGSQVVQIDSSLTKAKGIASLYNNLFIWGSTGIERWEATLQTNIFLFPFQKDNNFRKDYGAISTQSIVNGIDKIYFISSLFLPMALGPDGIVILPEGQDSVGFSKIISQYPDVENASGAFYTFRGNFFYHMAFPAEGISWIYNQNSNTLSQGDDLIIAAAPNQEYVLKNDGLYNLSIDSDHKRRQIVSARIVLNKDQATTRNLLNGVEIKIVQGYPQPVEPQLLELSISLDSQKWLNVIRIPIGATGRRNDLCIWRTNVAFQNEITIQIQYFGSYQFDIEKLTLTVN